MKSKQHMYFLPAEKPVLPFALTSSETVTAPPIRKAWQLPRWYRVANTKPPAFYIWREDIASFDLLFSPFANKVLKIKPEFRISAKNGSEDKNDKLVAIASTYFQQVFSMESISLTGRQLKVHLSLGLSNNCPLHCIYCHAESTDGSSTAMEAGLLTQAINDSFKTATPAGGMNVSFSAGGEPTFEWSLFELAVRKIKEESQTTGIPVMLIMTTNGIYGDKKRDFIATNFDSLTLSIDGIPSVHNTQRPDRKGQGTFSVAWDTAEYFARRGLSFGIRATVTQQGLHQMSNFVRMVSDGLGNIPIAFEPIVPIGRAIDSIRLGATKAANLRDFCDSYWHAFLLGKKLGMPVSTSMLNTKTVVASMCGALSLPARTITSSGFVTACHRDNEGTFAYGRYIQYEGHWVYTELEALQRGNIKNLSCPPLECDSCFCRWTCGGGCPDLRIKGISVCEGIRDLTFRGLVQHFNNR